MKSLFYLSTISNLGFGMMLLIEQSTENLTGLVVSSILLIISTITKGEKGK